MPDIGFLSRNERHAIHQTEDETVVIYTDVFDNGQETKLVERLIGIVEGKTIKSPHGALTRLRKDSESENINAELRLKPAGGVQKVEVGQILPDRVQKMPGRFQKDHAEVNDVTEF